MHDVFVSTTFMPDGASVWEAVGKLRDRRLSNIELGSNHCWERLNAEDFRKLDGRWLVHNYFPVPERSIILNPASSDSNIRAQTISQIRRSLQFTRDIGAELYTFHPGFIDDPQASSFRSENYDFLFHGRSRRTYEDAFDAMLNSLGQIGAIAHELGVAIAIETEGSMGKSQYLLMQRPEEFQRLFAHLGDDQLRVNLNLAHGRLAAQAFGFDFEELLNSVANRVVAVEVSHNDGTEDEHRPLMSGGWYFQWLKRLPTVPLIVETRNTSIEEITHSVDLLQSA